jgi:hypothetical protein
LAGVASAQSPVTLAITNSPGYKIPDDYAGLSFGAIDELPNHGGVSGYFFCATNRQLIALFKNSGLHHLRLGGSTVDWTNVPFPDNTAIDNVFGFAQAANLKVIYSVRLLNGDAATDVAAAKHIWKHYRPSLDYFAIGNEPDVKKFRYPPFGTGTDPTITNYDSCLAAWRRLAVAITNALPGAKFAGPDAAAHLWAQWFARDEKGSGMVALITQHFYIGGRPNGTTPQQAIDKMLSSRWVNNDYPSRYKNVLAPVVTDGLPYRLTESNDYLKGIAGASDSFASALWALDYLYWWAEHGCSGVNFHNTEWLKTDTVYLDDSSRSYRINPKAYGIKAFDLGSHGFVEPVAIANPNQLNLTAYAVGAANDFYVTIINKEHGIGGRNAAVNIVPAGFSARAAAAIFLTAPNGNAGAMNGITLGGAPITNDEPWSGKWTKLQVGKSGQCIVKVPKTSAAVVKLSVVKE